MMEFESSSAQYPHLAKRGQAQVPLSWHTAGMDQTNAFAGTGPANIHTQSCGHEASLQEVLTNGNGCLEYNWPNDLGFANNADAPASVPSQQDAGYLLDSKSAIQATITPLDFEDGTVLEKTNTGSQRPAQDGNAEYLRNCGFGAALGNNQFREQPRQFMNPPFEIGDATTSVEQVLLDVFGPNLGIETIGSDYTLPEELLPNGLGISQVDFAAHNPVARVTQDDEASQLGYSPITTAPFMYNSAVTESTGNWSSPFVPASDFINPPNNTQYGGRSIEEIEGVLFQTTNNNVINTTQSAQQVQPYGLAVPTGDYQQGINSSPGSVGLWESPRTPLRWDSSISPSPNPQAHLFPDPPMDDAFPRAMMNAFPPEAEFPQLKLHDLMGNFDINIQSQVKKRKRKAFNAEDKKKVNQVRENGACVSCHARRIPCAVGGVCAGCLKTAGDPKLAQEICLRTKLKDVYKSVKDIHDTLDDRQRRLVPLLESLTGEPKSVDLTVANPRLGYKFQLHLQVMKCKSSPSCRWKRLTKVNGIYVTQDVIQDQRYVIVPKSLPTIDQYDTFGRQILANSNGSHSGGLTQHLDEFLIGFCNNNPPSRLRQFANSTLRVASLSRLVAYGFLNIYDGSYDLLDRHTGIPITENSVTRRYVSETVHDQLRILAAEGLEPVERLVFAEIDNLQKLFGKERNGRIVSGICVLRLMLLYRDRVVRDSIRLALPRSGERHKKRLAKAAFMYKRLTIAYGTLCRETTPLIMTWEQENEKDPTVDDLVMINLFSTLQPAFEEFCNEKVSPEYDELFKGLILDATRIERRPSKKRKAEKDKGRVVECHDC